MLDVLLSLSGRQGARRTVTMEPTGKRGPCQLTLSIDIMPWKTCLGEPRQLRRINITNDTLINLLLASNNGQFYREGVRLYLDKYFRQIKLNLDSRCSQPHCCHIKATIDLSKIVKTELFLWAVVVFPACRHLVPHDVDLM